MNTNSITADSRLLGDTGVCQSSNEFQEAVSFKKHQLLINN